MNFRNQIAIISLTILSTALGPLELTFAANGSSACASLFTNAAKVQWPTKDDLTNASIEKAIPQAYQANSTSAPLPIWVVGEITKLSLSDIQLLAENREAAYAFASQTKDPFGGFDISPSDSIIRNERMAKRIVPLFC